MPDAAVVRLEDEEWGEVVTSMVTTSSEMALVTDALREHCREHPDPAAVNKLVAAADALPRTASGTVDRTDVRERLREGRRRGGL